MSNALRAPGTHRVPGNGGTDLLKLDDALAAVDDFVSVKLGL